MLDGALATGAKLELGGSKYEDDRHFELSLLSNVDPESKLMTEEVFGPLLPAMTFNTLDEPITFVNAGEKPLAMYIFSKSTKNQQHLIKSTSAGGTVINHCLVHFFNHNLPFGGVGHSGMGKSHGKFGFDEFTNERAILKQWSPIAGTDLMMPPYNGFKQKLIDFTIRFF